MQQIRIIADIDKYSGIIPRRKIFKKAYPQAHVQYTDINSDQNISNTDNIIAYLEDKEQIERIINNCQIKNKVIIVDLRNTISKSPGLLKNYKGSVIVFSRDKALMEYKGCEYEFFFPIPEDTETLFEERQRGTDICIYNYGKEEKSFFELQNKYKCLFLNPTTISWEEQSKIIRNSKVTLNLNKNNNLINFAFMLRDMRLGCITIRNNFDDSEGFFADDHYISCNVRTDIEKKIDEVFFSFEKYNVVRRNGFKKAYVYNQESNVKKFMLYLD